MPTHRLDSLLSEILAQAGPLIRSPAPCHSPDVTHLTIDSRDVGKGSLFVALKGAQVDGHRFVERAVEQGACAVLVDEDSASDFTHLSVPVLEARNTREVLGHVARVFYGDPFARLRAVIGITGTNGKTTSTYIAESLLEQAGFNVGVIGTINYRWGGQVQAVARNTTPESVVLYDLAHCMAEAGVDVLLMEVSSHGLEAHRLNGIRCDAAIFTNLTQDHLDFHGSMEAYKAAKKKLFFEHLASDGVAVLNLDDVVGGAWMRELGGASCQVTGFKLDGSDRELGEGVQMRGVTIKDTTLDGSVLRIAGHDVRFPLLGDFNVSNVMGVMCAIEGLGLMTREQLLAAMSEVRAVPGRMQRVNPGEYPAVFVDYAHTPDALEHALETLRPFTDGELCGVFGCGGDRDRGKRPLMGEVAARLADRVVLTSDNPRSEPPMRIIDAIIQGTAAHTERVEVEPDRALAIRSAIASADKEDVVLIAGKGHETYQELATGRIDFDDVKVAREALAQRPN